MHRRKLLHGRKLGFLAGFLTLLVLVIAAPSANAAVFPNSGTIVIPTSGTNGQSAPYPSAITVANLTGNISDVNVTLTNLSHTFPTDIDILLVGPSGQSVVLLTDTGGGTAITNVSITFDDAASTTVPTPIVGGARRPTNNGIFNGTAPAPAPPYGGTLSVFNGTNPNGAWKLYVYDDFPLSDGGSIASWSLDITTNGLSVTSFTPTSGPPATAVVITGTNFTGATGVSFGGVASTAFSIDSATQITAVVPAGATSGPISVTTPTGTASSTLKYQVNPLPTLAAFSPATGKVGSKVVIVGTNFSGVSKVTFAGIPAASFSVDSATQITVTVPAGAATGAVQVTTNGGDAKSLANFVVQHSRSLSLNLTRTKASGKISVDDGFSQAAASVPVRLQKRTGGAWHTVARRTTNTKGRYSFTGLSLSGRYRVLAPKTTIRTGDVALQAVSPTVRH